MRHRHRRLSGFQLGILSLMFILLVHLGSAFFPATPLRNMIAQIGYAIGAGIGFWSIARYDDHPWA